MPKSKPSRSSCLPLLTVLFLSLACLAVTAGLLLVFVLPARAAALFGPPAPGVGLFQHAYLSAMLLLHQDELSNPLNPAGEQKPFLIEVGESTPRITYRLQAEGFIPNSDALRAYLIYRGLDTTLQAGEYVLSPAMAPVQIAEALQDATPKDVTFNILPGWRLEEIAAALPTSGFGFASDQLFLEAFSRPPGLSFAAELPADASLEGFFLPGSYKLPRESTAAQFVASLLGNFDSQVGADLRQGFARQNLTLYQAVILASVVEREAIVKEEMPQIASVFLNRLAAGMKLDSDPTVQYALGYNAEQQTWWTNPLSAADLQVSSPFNTYQVPALPPGPIANPSLAALQAVAFPAQTPYFYFRAACDHSGRHQFAETFEQHVANACP
jgi:UPF0755 protein